AGKYATLSEAVRHHCKMVDVAEPIHAPLENLAKSAMQVHHNAHARRFLSLSNCEDLGSKDELSTSRGDVITEIHPLEKCYILARNERTGQTGYMSAKTLDPIVS
ncbi:hypothetical protein Angca_001595, partial [Angiostrongylus cantonensis]